jgi:hypothetical protein
VDFWELTKLLFRRWYIAAPMLLLSVGVTVFAGASVKPDYQATSHLQLLPSTTTASQTVGKPRNPWNDLGLDALGNAVIIRLGDQEVLDKLESQGHSSNFTVVLDNRTPVMVIEAVAPTPQQAIDSAQAVSKLIEQNVRQLQDSYGAPESTLITTHGLDAGTNVSKVTSKIKRALAVIGGVGLLLTSAVTIGVDAILRARSRRRSKAVAPTSPVDTWGERAGDGATVRVSRRAGVSAQVNPGDRDRSEAIRAGGERSRVAAHAANGANGGTGKERVKADREDAPVSTSAPMDEDATILLPKTFWSSSRGGRPR